MPFALHELWSVAGVLLALLLLYIVIETHYIFAFKLMQKTQIYQTKREKIERVRRYFFNFLHLLYPLTFMAVLGMIFLYLYEGNSLEAWIVTSWERIPEGFWVQMLWTLLRIALLIVVMRFLWKRLKGWLAFKKSQTITREEEEPAKVEIFYQRLQTALKIAIVWGVVYRIVHFFPFLSMLSWVLWWGLMLFLVGSVVVVMIDFWKMFNSRRNHVSLS
jgi:hypothetical protein